MKKLLVILLITSATYCQTISEQGVVLSYDKVDHRMTLTIPKQILKVNNLQDKVKIVVSRAHMLTVNKTEIKPIFRFTGYIIDSTSGFEHESVTKVSYKDFPEKYVYEFINVMPDEYILKVVTSSKETISLLYR